VLSRPRLSQKPFTILDDDGKPVGSGDVGEKVHARTGRTSVRSAEWTLLSRPRRLTLRDGREVTLRAIDAADAPEIVQAFERLTAESRLPFHAAQEAA
jgi:hypothetical protein